LFRIGYFLLFVRKRLQPGYARGGHWVWTVGCAVVPRSVRRLECLLRAYGLLRLYTSELNGTACTIFAAPKLGTTTCHYFDLPVGGIRCIPDAVRRQEISWGGYRSGYVNLDRHAAKNTAQEYYIKHDDDCVDALCTSGDSIY